jgi:putative membrane protein
MVALIFYLDSEKIAAALKQIGWGVLLIALVHLVPVYLTALSWRALLRPLNVRTGSPQIFWMRLVGDSVNQLLPVAQIGGEVVRGVMLRRRGVEGALTTATIVVDLTAGFGALILFILTGTVVLAVRGTGGGPSSTWPFAIALGACMAMLGGFLWLQRGGAVRRLANLSERLAGVELERLAESARELDARTRDLYRRRWPVLRAALFRFLGWIFGALEVWLSLWLLGHPVSFAAALILDSVGQTFRSGGFAVPAAVGVQEIGYVAGGVLAGVPEEIALSVALVKRARDGIIGVPVLLAWQGNRLRRLRGVLSRKNRP